PHLTYIIKQDLSGQQRMGGSDSRKPIYHGHNDEDVEEFLEDYEAYCASKDWDDAKKRQDTTNESNVTKSDMDDLTTAFNAMKICRVDQNADQDDRMSKMESSIKELTKAIISLKENKPPNARLKGESDEYLMIKAEEGKSLFDVRNLGKRRRVEDEHEMPSWAQKSTYIETPEETEQYKK
ncbi:16804_t:CDS:2, partial [Dentiscutata heterogama]